MTAEELINTVAKKNNIKLEILLDNRHRTPLIAKTRKELVIKLRAKPYLLSHRKIGEILRLGKTRVWELSRKK